MTARPTTDGVVYVVAKAPRAGASKTRLCPPLGLEQAATLSRAFLLDTLTCAHRAGVLARVICRDAEEQAALEPVVGNLASVRVQQGTGLGAALESAFSQGLREGFGAVGVLGSDCPTLPPHLLRQAYTAVEGGSDVALGPSADGGYYLLVARALYPALFQNMIWSTSTVAQTTLDRCAGAGLGVHLLPGWYDVDDAADLHRLREDLRRTSPSIARRTRAELLQLDGLPALAEALTEAVARGHGSSKSRP
ncbi:MAG: TIGR04282 family arsenosugar biosynthesis glycosyltransferase [Chloroflexota bacterium]|nr:TIGR04282 family arsenosugar biosynthesis glycosyltransferase [Chloroflexota bacterium]